MIEDRPTEELRITRESVINKATEFAQEAKAGLMDLKQQAPVEEFQMTGDQVMAKVKELVHEGNVRRIILRDSTGHNIAEFPLMAGVVGAVLLPVWAAVGAIAALAADLTLVVERREN